MTRLEVILEARSWLGTPFSHQGRVKGEKVDCIGIVVEVGRAMDIVDLTGVEKYNGYSRLPYLHTLRHACDEYFIKIRRSEVEPGDILMMGYGRDLEGHLAIMSIDDKFIHASCLRAVNKVCEQTIDQKWEQRVMGCYRYPGIE